RKLPAGRRSRILSDGMVRPFIAVVATLAFAAFLVLVRYRMARPRFEGDLHPEARELGRTLGHIFDDVEPMIRVGTKTREIDEAVKKLLQKYRVESSFVGYHGYPTYTTTSVNEEVINTPPSERALRAGDLLKLQIGIKGKWTFAIQGWTYPVG